MITYYEYTLSAFHFQHQQYWRKVDKIIMHQSFKGEALSWKGTNYIKICWRVYRRLRNSITLILIFNHSFQGMTLYLLS